MMNILLKQLTYNVPWTGDIRTDMLALLHHHSRPDLVEHGLQVGAQAHILAERFNVMPARAELGGWLHDIGRIVPLAFYLAAAQIWEVDVLPAEEQDRRLLHQKFSVVIARDVFQVTDEGVLSAIGCHTTMKPAMSPLDKVVFLADKLTWDGSTPPRYVEQIQVSLEQTHSLDAALHVYCRAFWEWAQQRPMFVPHPWFLEVLHSMKLA
jgi:predicted HD superfamily hydrolase involved in NAD metabolism